MTWMLGLGRARRRSPRQRRQAAAGAARQSTDTRPDLCAVSPGHIWPTADPRIGLPAGLLRRHRVAAGLSQEVLAERAGISTRGLSDLERGRSHAPRLDTLSRLAEALGLDAADRHALTQASGYLPRADTSEWTGVPST